jgi:hypothetical protein
MSAALEAEKRKAVRLATTPRASPLAKHNANSEQSNSIHANISETPVELGMG